MTKRLKEYLGMEKMNLTLEQHKRLLCMKEEVTLMFEELRFDPYQHLGMGDVRITLSQQEDILKLIQEYIDELNT